jgi:hypothetical protein
MKPIHNYLMNALSFEGYDQDPKTPTEKIAYFFEQFDSEYGWNTERVGQLKSLIEYLQGLPSSINIPYNYVDIISLAKWELREKGMHDNLTEKQEDNICENYWNYIANHLIQLSKKKPPYFENKHVVFTHTIE